MPDLISAVLLELRACASLLYSSNFVPAPRATVALSPPVRLPPQVIVNPPAIEGAPHRLQDCVQGNTYPHIGRKMSPMSAYASTPHRSRLDASIRCAAGWRYPRDGMNLLRNHLTAPQTPEAPPVA
jgi:hypothetical protein